jgi:hypothetical protein
MGVGPELTGRYGPLGLASRVEARIAAATLTARGVRLHAEARARLLLACERQRTRLLRRLAGNRLSKAIFKYSGGEPRLNRRGYPEVNEKRFNTWAVSILDDLTDLHGVPLGLVGVGSELIRHRDDLPDLDLGHPWLNCWLTCGVLAP